MSDHLDHDDAHGPKVDPEVDITDLYLFAAPGKIGRSVLIMNVYPLAPAQGANFATDVIYEVLVDTNDDAAPDVAFRTTFADGDNGQIATMRRAVGEAAAFRSDEGEVIVDGAPVSLNGVAGLHDAGTRQFFAGLRSDPFFFDLAGYLANFAFTGSDLFADKNVLTIALEMPTSDLGSDGPVGIWCRVLTRSHGRLLQIDRMGRPLVNVSLTQGVEKNL